MICPGLQWNGEEIGEIGMSIALAGELEVPVIVVSGDGGSHVSCSGPQRAGRWNASASSRRVPGHPST
jgi:hypothetical protein